jgi:uncharacterized damage-inducible protein DinB
MTPQACAIWDALEFRTPAVLAAVADLTDADLSWQPPNGANSIGWLLWHIAEVEDNWIRAAVLNLPRRYPFGASVKAAHGAAERPGKDSLLAYLDDVRALSRERLDRTIDDEFDRMVTDEHYGQITVRQVWAGAATSGAWHGGQIVLIVNRLLTRAERA